VTSAQAASSSRLTCSEKLAKLQVHHIFPKDVLYKAGYAQSEVNAIANFCFLTQDANLEILNRPPSEYFTEVEMNYPGALASQWIPSEDRLRPVDRYRDFLASRRDLLASAANAFLDSLITARPGPGVDVLTQLPIQPAQDVGDEVSDADGRVAELVGEFGLAAPTAIAVVEDRDSGAELGMADFLWADGLQGGYDEPVVLAFDPGPNEAEQMIRAGYRVFRTIDALRAVLGRRADELAGVSARS
jgi:hypothetical protein